MNRSMKRLAMSAALWSLSAVSSISMAAEPFVAGKDYTVLSPAGTVEKAGMIEVREFFLVRLPALLQTRAAYCRLAENQTR